MARMMNLNSNEGSSEIIYEENISSKNASPTFFNFPNPFKDNTIIKYQFKDVNSFNLEILDIYGRIMQTENSLQNVENTISEIKINMCNLKNGIYICCAKSNGTVLGSFKIVIAD